MFISLEELKAQGVDCAGMRVLHVGACQLEELPKYNTAGIADIVWVEARPDAVMEMRAKHPREKILQACVGSSTGKTVTFDTYANGMCSSALRSTAYLRSFTRAKVNSSCQMKIITLSDLFSRSNIQRPFDFLNVDVQGLELEVLKGYPDKWWPFVKVVYVEVNAIAQYEGSCTPEEVDLFLMQKGFVKKCEKWCGNVGYADVVYVRNQVL